MSDLISRFSTLPSYGLAGLVVILLYAVQSEIRFGKRARAHRAGSADRYSTVVVSVSAAIVILGFALAIKAASPSAAPWLPNWFCRALLPGLPAVAWLGVAMGLLGLFLRLWAVLTLRERYTRTLLIQDEQTIERSGPYYRVRHPGYLGSLLCLNGIALASGNTVTLIVSLLATVAAYSYRIRIEDEMLVRSLGPPYLVYRQQVGALLPSVRLRGPEKPACPGA